MQWQICYLTLEVNWIVVRPNGGKVMVACGNGTNCSLLEMCSLQHENESKIWQVHMPSWHLLFEEGSYMW